MSANCPTIPVNQSKINNAQSSEAHAAMDGIKPADINQAHLPQDKQVGTNDSFLDMMTEGKTLHDDDEVPESNKPLE